MQELTIQAIAKKTIHWILLEPKLKDNASTAYKATQEFKNLVQFLSPPSTVDEYGEGIEEYMEKIESGTKKLPDIFMAVDLKKKIFDLHMPRVKGALEKGKDPHNPRCLSIMTPDYPASFTTY